MRKKTPLADRIKANVIVSGAGCWEWQLALNKGGYGQIKLSNNGVKRMGLTHRVSFENFKGPIPTGLWVLHRCHNRRCCNPEHLYAGDRMQNARDMVESGRSLFGDRQTTFKRTPELVENVNKLRKNGLSRKEIMARLAIGGRTYDRIKSDGLIDPEANRLAGAANRRAAQLRNLER